jgi:precorrin-3B C17-methyltransferase
MSSDAPKGKLYVVGIGPGNSGHLTFAAREALTRSNVIVGYRTYIKLLGELTAGKRVITGGMGEEVKRAAQAISLAAMGETVSLVSSGDPGVYGMAGLVMELLYNEPDDSRLDVQVVPGVPVLCSAAALLGAPLMHDFASISLSDRLTPWKEISQRLRMAAKGNFVIVLYNPRSRERQWQLVEARKILLGYRRGSVPVGIVDNAYRAGQKITITDLEHMLDFDIGMATTIIVGNSTTYTSGGWVVTPRGYQTKYGFNGGD